MVAGIGGALWRSVVEIAFVATPDVHANHDESRNHQAEAQCKQDAGKELPSHPVLAHQVVHAVERETNEHYQQEQKTEKVIFVTVRHREILQKWLQEPKSRLL